MTVKLHVEVTTGGKLAFTKGNIRRVIAKAANQIAADAATLIRSSGGGGVNYRGHSASMPGSPPSNRTGKLAGSIKATLFRNGEGALIKDMAKYALSLEAGARGGVGSFTAGKKGKRNKRVTKKRLVKIIVGNRVLKPRPFLSIALERRRSGLDRSLRSAADADFSWVQAPK